MSRGFTIRVLALVVGASLAPFSAHAFGHSGAGVKLGFGPPENLEGTMRFGAHVELEQPEARVHLIPGFLYWREDGFSDLNPNLDAYYHFLPDGRLTPYVGAGVGLHVLSHGEARTETDLGANFFGGMRIPAAASHYFVEGRYVMSEMFQLSIMGGVTFQYW